jgi:hypothetical protein
MASAISSVWGFLQQGSTRFPPSPDVEKPTAATSVTDPGSLGDRFDVRVRFLVTQDSDNLSSGSGSDSGSS